MKRACRLARQTFRPLVLLMKKYELYHNLVIGNAISVLVIYIYIYITDDTVVKATLCCAPHVQPSVEYTQTAGSRLLTQVAC